MVLYDLPTEISNLFLVNEIISRNKTEILEFCDSIQDLVQNMREVPQEGNQTIQNPLNRMEMFEYNSELLSSSDGHDSIGTGKTAVKRGRPRKNLNAIQEDCEDNVSNLKDSSSTIASIDRAVYHPKSVRGGRGKEVTVVKKRRTRIFNDTSSDASSSTIRSSRSSLPY